MICAYVIVCVYCGMCVLRCIGIHIHTHTHRSYTHTHTHTHTYTHTHIHTHTHHSRNMHTAWRRETSRRDRVVTRLQSRQNLQHFVQRRVHRRQILQDIFCFQVCFNKKKSLSASAEWLSGVCVAFLIICVTCLTDECDTTHSQTSGPHQGP